MKRDEIREALHNTNPLPALGAVLAFVIVWFRKAFRRLRPRREPLSLNLPPFEKLEPAPIRMPVIPAADEEERVAACQLEVHTRSAYLEPSRAIGHRERLGLPIPTVISPTMLEVVTEAKKQIDTANAERNEALKKVDELTDKIGAAHIALTEANIRHEPNLADRVRALQADRATWKSRYEITKRANDTFQSLEEKTRALLWGEARRTNRYTRQMPASTVEAVRELIERFKRRLARARSKPKAKRRK